MSELAARNTDLLEKLAIREVLERYMRWNDDGMTDRIAELFTEDAIFQVVGRQIVGREAIRTFFKRGGTSTLARGPTKGCSSRNPPRCT